MNFLAAAVHYESLMLPLPSFVKDCYAVFLLCLQAHNGSLFPSAVVTLYGSYLCYSALQSEPHNYECNGLGKHFTAASGSTLAIGMVIAIVSVVYSALRAGSNNRTFMSSRDEAVEEGLLQTGDEGTSAGLDGQPEGQSMGKLQLCLAA